MIEVKHDPKAKEFYVETEKGKASLNYEPEGKGVLNFHHTFVPPELRGQGVGEQMVKAGFEYATQNNLKINPTCPYVVRLVMKNSEWKKFVVRS